MSMFTQRSQQIEIMDDLTIQGQVIDFTLRELEVINRLLGGNRVTLNGVSRLLKGKIKSKVTIVDLGCGGGDILKLVAQWGRKNNQPMKLIGIDANPNIVAYAQSNSLTYPEISYEAINIFSKAFRQQQFDIVLATLFTHHFTDDELADLFQSLKKQSAIGIVINDLHRHWFAFHSIAVLTRFFSKSYMVKADAPLSVLRAFRKHELENILDKAGIHAYSLRWRWAFRWQLIIPSHQVTDNR